MPNPFLCDCHRPKARDDGAGGKLCVECHGRLPAKKVERLAVNDARMTPEQLKAELSRRAARLHRLVTDEVREMQNLIDRHAS